MEVFREAVVGVSLEWFSAQSFHGSLSNPLGLCEALKVSGMIAQGWKNCSVHPEYNASSWGRYITVLTRI